MAKTACYVDGFNLYHAIEGIGVAHLKWLNLKALATTFLRPEDNLESVVYFSAYMVWDQIKYQRHKAYVTALKSVGVETVMSKFLKSDKHCRTYARYCSFTEEKQTDVAFCSRVISDVLARGIERAILVTADSDQVPTVAALRGLSPQTSVVIACPPGRSSIAKELSYVAHDSREISRGRIEKCLFQRTVRNAKGTVVAICPAAYDYPAASG